MRIFGSLKSLSIFISIPQIWFYFQIILLPLRLFSFWATLWIYHLDCFHFFLTNKDYPHSLGYYREDYVHFGSLKSLNIFISIPQIWFYSQIALLPLGLFSFWASLWISSNRVDLNLEIAAQFPCNLKSASTTLFFLSRSLLTLCNQSPSNFTIPDCWSNIEIPCSKRYIKLR